MAVKGAVSVLSEHYNATWHVHFCQALAGLQTHRLLARSADEIEAVGWRALKGSLEDECRRFDVKAAVLSRYVDPFGADVIAFYRGRGVKVCFFIDDWLFDLPEDLGDSYRRKYNGDYVRKLEERIGEVDVVLAATEYLARAVRGRFPGKDVRFYSGMAYANPPRLATDPLAYARRLRRRLRLRGSVTIGYMGSSSHIRDLALIEEPLARLMVRFHEVRFETFGLPVPRTLAAFGAKRTAQFGYVRDYAAYLGQAYELGWDFGVCPLRDDEFNRCKTAIKLVEYASCGVPALCSAVEPYSALCRVDRELRLVGPREWPQALERWVADRNVRKRALAAARRDCSRIAPDSGRLLAAIGRA